MVVQRSANANTGIVIFIILILIDFFWLIIIPTSRPVKVVELCLLFFIANDTYKKRNKTESVILLISLLVTISVGYSYFINKQKFFSVLAMSFHYYGLMSYFMLKYFSLSPSATIKVVRNISVMMIAFYILQWLVYPTIIFGSAQGDIDDSTGLFRMRFVSSICSYLTFFWAMNKFYMTKRFVYLIYAGFGFFPMLMMGFRSLMTLSVLAVILMLFFTSKKLGKYLINAVFVFIIGIFVIQAPLVQDKIDEMFERQKSDQSFDNESYIRWLALDYYESYYESDMVMRFVGGGVPLVTRATGKEQRQNKYQSDIEHAMNHKMYWNDLGLIGLSYLIGIPAVLLIVGLCVYYAWKCKSFNLQYIRFTLVVLLLGSIITSMELFRAGNFLILGMLFYYIDTSKTEAHLTVVLSKKDK